MCRVVSLVLEAGVQAPAQARRFSTRYLESWGLADLVDDVLLLVSELVTNAVRHARTSATLTLAVADGVLEAAVRDDAGHVPMPRLRGTPPTTDEGGRGLHLVDTVADEWGVADLGSAKHVWFRLAVPEAWRAEADCRCSVDEHAISLDSGRPAVALSPSGC